MDINAIHRHISACTKAECDAAGQMTLGEFIDELTRMCATGNDDKRIEFDFAGIGPTTFGSYRGYYDHLALGFSDEAWPLAKDILESAKKALGATFIGYKGGDYVMTTGTPLWAANYSRSGGQRIVGLKDTNWRVFILTRNEDLENGE